MIAVVGHTAIDHIFSVPVLPERHGSTFITRHTVYYGGGAANIAAGIARLGGEAELISAVGGDFPGSKYETWMNELGIRRRLFMVGDERTATCYLYNDADGDQMTFFEWGASSAFATAEAPALDMVHLATADPSFNVRVAERGSFVSFDPGQDLLRYSKEDLEAIIANTDILFANRHEVRGMCTTMGITKDALFAQVPRAICTMSGDGSFLIEGGERRFVPAIPVGLADPTGAGDAYRAGFLTALSGGYDALTAAKVGTTAASFVVEVTGCQTNLPTWETMGARYREHFGALPAPGE
ncbi:sugar kinase [Methanomicrobiaceae archaeon CYW5]|uniref:carbohydrate kinase family protein n=1 Tax=Methanovulcanius yangii TaxID=1789227 RepID=UPI0029CA387D|nr:carbohydrate kinase family protein [Methanovulcanius yangii]MBT8507961.1 sugar kinase [Methanovulcanius yangii]